MPDIRGGLKRFMVMQAKEGKPISTMWEDLYNQDVKAFFQMAIAVHPKELSIEVDQNVTVDATQAEEVDWDALRLAQRARLAKEVN